MKQLTVVLFLGIIFSQAWSAQHTTDMNSILSEALGDFYDSILCTHSLYYDITGNSKMETIITAFDADYLSNVLIGGRKMDTSLYVADTTFKAYLYLIQGATCFIQNVYIFDNMDAGIKAVALNTSIQFNVVFQIAAVGYEMSGEEFVMVASIQDEGAFELESVKIPIATNSEVVPQGLHIRKMIDRGLIIVGSNQIRLVNYDTEQNWNASTTISIPNIKRSFLNKNTGKLSIAKIHVSTFNLLIQQLDSDFASSTQYSINHAYTSLDVLVRVSAHPGNDKIITCSHELSPTSGYQVHYNYVDPAAMLVRSFTDSTSYYCLQARISTDEQNQGEYLLIDHDQNVFLAKFSFIVGTLRYRKSISHLSLVDAYDLGTDSVYAMLTVNDQWMFGRTTRLHDTDLDYGVQVILPLGPSHRPDGQMFFIAQLQLREAIRNPPTDWSIQPIAITKQDSSFDVMFPSYTDFNAMVSDVDFDEFDKNAWVLDICQESSANIELISCAANSEYSSSIDCSDTDSVDFSDLITDKLQVCYKMFYHGYMSNFDEDTMKYINDPLDVEDYTVRFKDELSRDDFGQVEMYSFIFFTNWGRPQNQESFTVVALTTLIYIDTQILGENISQTFLQNVDETLNYDMSVDPCCVKYENQVFTEYCSNFIKLDMENKEWSIDKADLQTEDAAGTYVNYNLLRHIPFDEIERETYSVVYFLRIEPFFLASSPINITDQWPTFYEENKSTFRYKMSQPSHAQILEDDNYLREYGHPLEQSEQSEFGELDEAFDFFNQETNEQIQYWDRFDRDKYLYSDELEELSLPMKKIALAALPFVEHIPNEWESDFVMLATIDALYRQNVVEEIEIQSHDITITDMGILTIDFKNSLPWYIYRIYSEKLKQGEIVHLGNYQQSIESDNGERRRLNRSKLLSSASQVEGSRILQDQDQIIDQIIDTSIAIAENQRTILNQMAAGILRAAHELIDNEMQFAIQDLIHDVLHDASSFELDSTIKVSVCPQGFQFVDGQCEPIVDTEKDEGASSGLENFSIYYGDLNQLIQIDIESIGNQITNAQLVAIDNQSISIKLEFQRPFLITENDILAISLPVTSSRDKIYKALLPQSNQKWLQTAKETGQTVKVASAGVILLRTILQRMTKTALSQVWALINGIQIITHMPLFAIEFPDFVLLTLKEIIQIAIFDIPYLDADTLFGGWLVKLPEDDKLDIRDKATGEHDADLVQTFETLGYESRFISRTMGSVFVIVQLLKSSLLIYLVIKPFVHRVKLLQKLQNFFLKHDLVWGAVIRTLLEASLELFFACSLSLRYLLQHWDDTRTQDETVSFSEAFSLWVVLILMPVWILVFYCKNFDRMKDNTDSEFQKSYGEIYSGLRQDQRSSILFNSMFVFRRIVFVEVTMNFESSISLQIFSQILLCTVQLVYIEWSQPMDTRKGNLIEIFNEETTSILMIIALGLTDAVKSMQFRNSMGSIFLLLVIQNVFVHLAMLIYDSMKKLQRILKNRKNRHAKIKLNLTKFRNRKRESVSPQELSNLPQHHQQAAMLFALKRHRQVAPIKQCMEQNLDILDVTDNYAQDTDSDFGRSNHSRNQSKSQLLQSEVSQDESPKIVTQQRTPLNITFNMQTIPQRRRLHNIQRDMQQGYEVDESLQFNDLTIDSINEHQLMPQNEERLMPQNEDRQYEEEKRDDTRPDQRIQRIYLPPHQRRYELRIEFIEQVSDEDRPRRRKVQRENDEIQSE